MKAFWRVLAVLVAIVSTVPALQAATPDGGPVSIAVDSISLDNVGSDSVTLSVQSHVTSTRTLRIKKVRFEQMRMGRLPIYLDPVDEKLSLTAGQPVALPAVPVTIYFRDLDSLAPLQQAVSDGLATVEGSARVDLDLNVLERFATNQWNAHADMPIAVTVPVELPGGFLGRAAALVALSAAQVAMDVGGTLLDPLRQSEAGEAELRRLYGPSLVRAESRYTLIRHQQSVDIVVRQLGFRISADQFVLTGEMIEPWKYDADVVAALKTGEATLVPGSPELRVWTAVGHVDEGSACSLAKGDIKLLHAPKKTESTEVPTADGHMKVQVGRRDSNDNYALLRFSRSGDYGPPVTQSAVRSQSWNRLAAFRLSDDGTLDVVATAAHREGDRIVLSEPLDSAAFGSVLVGVDGVAGFVQDERSGTLLRTGW